MGFLCKWLMEPVCTIELKMLSEHSNARVDTTGSYHSPCYEQPIWLERLVWQRWSLSVLVSGLLSILVLVRLLTVHRRNQELKAMYTNASTAEEEKKKEWCFQRNSDN